MDKLEIIHKAVCEYYNMDLEEIFKPSRNRRWTEPRQVMWYLFRQYFDKIVTTTEMGTYSKPWGTTWDHCSVLHGSKRIKELMEIDNGMRQIVNDLKIIINLQLAPSTFELLRANIVDEIKNVKTESELSLVISKWSAYMEKEIPVFFEVV